MFSVRQRVSIHNKVFTKLKRENHDRTSSFSRAHESRAIGHMFHSQDWTKTKHFKIQWSLSIMNLYIAKSSVEKNDSVYPSNSKIYRKEPLYNETLL